MSLSNSFDNLSIDKVIRDNFGKLREMPSIPLLKSHDVIIDFFIEIIKKTNSLNDHHINFLSGEFKLISRETMSNTQSHHSVIFFIIN